MFWLSQFTDGVEFQPNFIPALTSVAAWLTACRLMSSRAVDSSDNPRPSTTRNIDFETSSTTSAESRRRANNKRNLLQSLNYNFRFEFVLPYGERNDKVAKSVRDVIKQFARNRLRIILLFSVTSHVLSAKRNTSAVDRKDKADCTEMFTTNAHNVAGSIRHVSVRRGGAASTSGDVQKLHRWGGGWRRASDCWLSSCRSNASHQLPHRESVVDKSTH